MSFVAEATSDGRFSGETCRDMSLALTSGMPRIATLEEGPDSIGHLPLAEGWLTAGIAASMNFPIPHLSRSGSSRKSEFDSTARRRRRW
jgi:hypothetical protein